MTKYYDYLIVGAGLFGATLAYKLKKAGKSVIVLEKRHHLGGTVHTEEISGIQVHMYGAHIFRTSNKGIWEFINQFAEFNGFVNSPMAIYQDEIYNLPFNMNTFSKLFNIKTPQEAKAVIEREIKAAGISEPNNLEEKAISLVGTTIYEKLIKGYTGKQWGKPCRDLPASILNRLPVRYIYDNNYYNERYQGIPLGGYTRIIEKMLDGVTIVTNCDYLKEKEKYRSFADKIIYTGQIDKYFSYCFGELEYRSLKFEHFNLEETNYQGNAVINYTEYEVPYTRIIEHKHFEFNLCPNFTVITKEYPASYDKEKNEPYYPINDEKNTALYNKYLELSKKDPQVIFGGRLGMYKYFDMTDTIDAALKLAESLLND
ncbi:MAG: UDP-galactopyranose mutase [Erysipelotrichaceae bacterium]|jgi:UDP-galactopyranose mutase|nr:UDP-galactopyranose mutase [Erysipelotrichaceae bacterium]